ncbi:MAG: protein-L-isoaspartate(D-aspartate) O-methyltransferase [Desulfobacterales bacterium]
MDKIFLISVILVLLCSCNKNRNQTAAAEGDEYLTQRLEMIDQQIRSRGVTGKRLLDALEKVPRERFVPASVRTEAYRDEPLPIGWDQTISQPYIVAYMTEQLDLQKTDRVLEIGTGSGYQAAVLAEMADSVYTIEIIPELSRSAQKVLRALGYTNIFFKTGDGYQGWPDKAPFDAIIVTAAPSHVPAPLEQQLKIGGKMIIPVGENSQVLYLLEKTERGESEQDK